MSQDYHRAAQKLQLATMLLLPFNKFHFFDTIPKLVLMVNTMKNHWIEALWPSL